MIYPNNFEQKIGFDTIRNNIKKMCVNDLSCTFIDKLGFLNDYFLIKNRLDYCQEMFGILESNVNILPIYPVDEFRFIFKSTEVEGTFLEANTIFLLKKLLENINLLVDFFLNKDNEKYPLLTKYVSNIEVFPNILKEISKILEVW